MEPKSHNDLLLGLIRHLLIIATLVQCGMAICTTPFFSHVLCQCTKLCSSHFEDRVNSQMPLMYNAWLSRERV